jgi:hypothetical protein
MNRRPWGTLWVVGVLAGLLAGCGAGGKDEPKLPGVETIRATPRPPQGIGQPPAPPAP